MDKTVKLEWHKLSNTRTRCLRITQASAPAPPAAACLCASTGQLIDVLSLL